MVQEIETLLGRQSIEKLDFEALEVAVRQQVLQLAGQAVEQRLNADTTDERCSRTGCGCGQQARYAGRNAPGCTGPFTAPTPSSLSAVPAQ